MIGGAADSDGGMRGRRPADGCGVNTLLSALGFAAEVRSGLVGAQVWEASQARAEQLAAARRSRGLCVEPM